MSRQPNRRARRGPKLPFALHQKLGFTDDGSRSTRRGQHTHVSSRTVRQKPEERRGGSQHTKHPPRRPIAAEEIYNPTSKRKHAKSPELLPRSTNSSSNSPKTFSKSSLKIDKSPTDTEDEFELEDSPNNSRQSSPELVLDASSRTFKKRVAQDETEISSLEKKLGIKKSKKRKQGEDGFEDILGDLDFSSENEQAGHDERQWLENKRRKVSGNGFAGTAGDVGRSTSEDEESDESRDSASGDEDSLWDQNDGSQDEEDSLVEADLVNGKNAHPVKGMSQPTRVRENPYKAPVAAGTIISKYVPPSLRKPSEGESEKLKKLQRQIQGHLNKLSEANIISILGEVEKLYQTNPRQDTTSLLIENIVSAFSNPSALQNTFIILHAAFLAAVYKVLGNDFGAELVCKIVERFDSFNEAETAVGKECLNLISLLANLFTFNVISSTIIYDQIRLLLTNFSERNAELLLRVVRDCGPQLRSDDPSALKDIVSIMHNTATEIAKEGKPMNIRTRVMMDTITDLKNNKMKQATNAAGLTGEHITRMRKALGSLNTRQLRGTEPLRISRDDIANSEKKGKWWLIGASWKGNAEKTDEQEPVNLDHRRDLDNEDSGLDLTQDVDFASLARQYKMNTDVRRSIFVAIMSAEDRNDALSRISKLRLTRKQEPEIARVLLRCCRAEPKYNPYYPILAKKLLRDRRDKMSFEIALWKFFEEIGERNNEDEEDGIAESRDEAVELTEIINIARMYAFLVSKGSIGLDVLKTLNIGFTKEKGTIFLELFLVSILNQSNLSEDDILRIFGRVESRLVKSLQYFLRQKVQRSDLVGKAEKLRLKSNCKIAFDALGMIEALDNDFLS